MRVAMLPLHLESTLAKKGHTRKFFAFRVLTLDGTVSNVDEVELEAMLILD